MMAVLPHLCTIQRRYQKQLLSFASGTHAFLVGATVTGGVSGATAKINKVQGTTATGSLVLTSVSSTPFAAAEHITDTSGGSANTSALQTNYWNGSNEAEYYWSDSQTKVYCRFDSIPSRLGVLYPGQFESQKTYLMLNASAKCQPVTEYRIVSTTVGYTPASGMYKIMNVRPWVAGMNANVIDHYTCELEEVVLT